jgi:hypothetical protein
MSNHFLFQRGIIYCDSQVLISLFLILKLKIFDVYKFGLDRSHIFRLSFRTVDSPLGFNSNFDKFNYNIDNLSSNKKLQLLGLFSFWNGIRF